MSDDCLFCRIAAGKVPSDVAFEDDILVAFRDIHPKAPVHLLIVPKKHIVSLADMTASDEPLIGKLLYRAKLLAEEQGIAKDGYKIVINTRDHGGQFVDHLHIHLLGGEKLNGPV